MVVSISRATGWPYDVRPVVPPVLADRDSGGSSEAEGGGPVAAECPGGAPGGASVPDITTGPGSTRPVPFAGVGPASGPATVIVRDGGRPTGPRGSGRPGPALIRSSRR